ncbi:hypothetical protein Tco_0139896 [Tanacetum coccineum]
MSLLFCPMSLSQEDFLDLSNLSLRSFGAPLVATSLASIHVGYLDPGEQGGPLIPVRSAKDCRIWAQTHRHIWLCIHGLRMEGVVIRRDSYKICRPVIQRYVPSLWRVDRGSSNGGITSLSLKREALGMKEVNKDCRGWPFSFLPKWAAKSRERFISRLPFSSTLASNGLLPLCLDSISQLFHTKSPSLKYSSSVQRSSLRICLRLSLKRDSRIS